MKSLFTFLVAAALLVPVAIAAKGMTTRITITEIAGGRSIDIVDPLVLSKFNVWTGPGTHSGPPNQQVEGSEGFIIDWPAGPVASHPSGLPRYTVKFYVRFPNAAEDSLAYVVQYERDLTGRAGYVYLPGRSDESYHLNTGSIFRGVEGNWFRASEEWQKATAKAIALHGERGR